MVEKTSLFRGLGGSTAGSPWLMHVKRRTFLYRVQPNAGQSHSRNRRHQIIQPQVVAEMKPAGWGPGDAFNVKALQTRIREQPFEPLRRNELVEIVAAPGD